MILNYSHLFNTISDSFQEIYDKHVFQHINDFVCPCCGRSHCLSFFSTYRRYIIDLYEPCRCVDIIVLYCHDCGYHTSVLPHSFLPFSTYSYLFIIHALFLYFFTFHENKSKTCHHLNISRKTLNHFLQFFYNEDSRITRLFILKENLKAHIVSIHHDPHRLPDLLSHFFLFSSSVFLMPSISRRIFLVFFPPSNTWVK